MLPLGGIALMVGVLEDELRDCEFSPCNVRRWTDFGMFLPPPFLALLALHALSPLIRDWVDITIRLTH